MQARAFIHFDVDETMNEWMIEWMNRWMDGCGTWHRSTCLAFVNYTDIDSHILLVRYDDADDAGNTHDTKRYNTCILCYAHDKQTKCIASCIFKLCTLRIRTHKHITIPCHAIIIKLPFWKWISIIAVLRAFVWSRYYYRLFHNGASENDSHNIHIHQMYNNSNL